ncbi:MAG TPA: phosphohistidine phosphatase SixA [Gemmataceae bacterium]|nr:phosphohistidine phosphatase SixA [Gemmataceae bacterium]
MDVYLIRHADALALGERGITEDENRPLSEKGEKQAAQVGVGLQRRGVHLDLLLTSPLVRARQTADALVHQGTDLVAELQTCDLLAPGGKRSKLAKVLREANHNAVGLVGHQPDLGEFAAWLIGSRKINLELSKAGVALIRSEEPGKGGGTLIWLVTPEWFT